MSVTVGVPPRYACRARHLAEDRNQSSEENDAWDNESNTWGVDPIERTFRGLMGEFAFAEYAGLTIDTSISRWSVGHVSLCQEFVESQYRLGM